MNRAFYDTECFPNYWLLKVRTDYGYAFSFSLNAGQSFDARTREEIRGVMDSHTVISFNGIYYDVPMISAALAGFTCEQLKWLNDQIIVEKRKSWDLGLPEWKPRDHIDIMEVLPGKGSQKQYAGRIHCKMMRDLPYSPDQYLSDHEIAEVDSYCGNDLDVLEELYKAASPQIQLRESLSERYGIDLRSKSDAQLGEAIIRKRCEQALGRRVYKTPVDYNLRFRYDPPAWMSFQHPQLVAAFETIQNSIFTIGFSGRVEMPEQIKGLQISIGNSVYRMGIGGLHSSESCVAHFSDEHHILRDSDVVSYYPNMMINSGRYPAALGPTMLVVFESMKDERIVDKKLQAKLKEQGDTSSEEYKMARVGNEGGKVAINGPFGKTNEPNSILRAPEMFIQTTITGQLALLMLIEWKEHYGISVVSANTDGVVARCPRHLVPTSDYLIEEWQRRTGLEMETVEYKALYSRDVNAYIALKPNGECKRKGPYANGGLNEKTNPDIEICGDAVAEFLSKGTPILYTIASCRDIRKFVTIQKVAGGAVKLWGEGPRKDMKVVDMAATLLANGWSKSGRKWEKDGTVSDATTAYRSCFQPQTPEYLGKVIRWYYSTQAPGSIIYNSNGNTVSLSYGARPCMTPPDEFPSDIDYGWYVANCEKMLMDVGYYSQQKEK